MSTDRPAAGATAPPEGPRRQAAGHALIAGIVGLLLASLLNAHSLAEVAQRQEEGVLRSVAVALTGAVERVSSTLWLDRPRTAIDTLTGRSGEVAEVRAPVDPPAAVPTDDFVPALDLPPTASDPAEAWIIGDSLVELFGPKLADEMVDSEVVDPEVDFRFISGLSRPDVFDWPSHIRQRMRTDPPEMVVAMFGGNDGQPVKVDDVVYVEYTPEWWELYRDRVAEVMDILRGDRLAYWIGLPIMKDPDFRAHAAQFNEVYREEAAERGWMRYVSSWEVFADDAGNYADYLPNHNGDLRLMRYQDGAHFTPSGALRLALRVFDVIARDLRIAQRD